MYLFVTEEPKNLCGQRFEMSCPPVRSSLEGISGQKSRTSKWLDFFGSWMGLLLVAGILLFGITGRIQFSCNPMVTLGVLPSFCQSAEIIQNASSRPTHGDSINKIAADTNQDSETLAQINQIQQPLVEDNPQLRTYALAGNPKTPEKVLVELAQSDDKLVLNKLNNNDSVKNNSRVRDILCNYTFAEIDPEIKLLG